MSSKFKFRFFHRLLIGFLLVGAMLVAISVLGISFIQSNSRELGMLLTQQVQPMERLSSLLAQANDIRRREVELPRIADYFALNSGIVELRAELVTFSEDLELSLKQVSAVGKPQLIKLRTSWDLYKNDLKQTLELAALGRLDEANEFSTYLSGPRFAIFVNGLYDLSKILSEQAAEIYDESVERQQYRKKLFILLSIFGIIVGIGFAIIFSKAISRRIRLLSSGANRLAMGNMDQIFSDQVDDELGELAESLNEMRKRISQREQDLRDFSNNLETMVLERTAALDNSNRRLRDSEASLRRAQFLAGLGSWEFMPEKRVVRLSEQLRQMLACEEAVLPADLELILQKFIFPKDRSPLQELISKSYPDGVLHGTEMRIRNTRGEIRHVWLEGEWQQDESGQLLKAIGVVFDITERKQIEEHLMRSQRLDAVGQLAGGIAHDFNNLLSVIVGNTFMAERPDISEEKRSRYLNEIGKASERAQDLAYKLLTFAKGGEQKRQIVSVADLMRETSELMMAGFRLTPELLIAEDLWPINADRGQIAQVLQNLLINARDAMAEKGDVLRLIAENINLTEADNPVLEPGPYLKIAVSDSGCGISDADLPKIFDLYYSTKKRGLERGTGLGLAICHSIIRKHGGDIQVSSTLGEGTTFTFYLPAAIGQVDEGPMNGKLIRGRGNLLVMDDEPMVLEVAQELLNYIGYQVDLVSSGEQAVESYRARLHEGTPYDAVILDLTVRDGMGGQETLARLLEIDSQVKAIASSGYADQILKVQEGGQGWSAICSKPYRIEDLSQSLHQLLGEDSSYTI